MLKKNACRALLESELSTENLFVALILIRFHKLILFQKHHLYQALNISKKQIHVQCNHLWIFQLSLLQITIIEHFQ